MGRRLSVNVYVEGRLYSEGSEEGVAVPAGIAVQIGDHCWASESDVATEPEPPHAPPSVPNPGDEGSPPPPNPDGGGAGEAADGTDEGPQAETVGEPPRAGRGSSRDAWAAYAGSLGVTVTDEMSRDDIIAAVDSSLA